MAKSKVAPRRRSIVAFALVGFVLVATGVIARRVLGVRQQREIQRLQRQREALDAERMKQESAIRDASSRARLQPIAEQRLHMHIAKPEEQVILKGGATTTNARRDSL